MTQTTPAQDEDDLLLERQLCFAVSVASRSIVSAYRPVLAELNLTHPQYLMMLALWEKSPRTVKDLSLSLMLEPATISPLLKRLESSGLLTRRRVPADERSLAVELTPEGAALRRKALAVPGIMGQRLGLDRSDAEELRVMMDRIIKAASEADMSDASAEFAGEDLDTGENSDAAS